MKKSNQLLLTIFLIAVLLLTAVHIALYAKYKKGDYTLYSGDDALVPVFTQAFPHAKFVAVRDLSDVRIAFGDTTKVESGNKEWSKTFSIAHTGDTLLVSRRDTTEEARYSSTDVRIYLSQSAQLAAYNSILQIESGQETPVALSLFLENSKAQFIGQAQALRFTDVKLTATKESEIELQNVAIQNLDASLSQSTLNDFVGNIGQLSITADTASRITLQSKHFIKAKQPVHE